LAPTPWAGVTDSKEPYHILDLSLCQIWSLYVTRYGYTHLQG